MLKMDELQLRMLKEVADLHKVPEGAYNIRSNGKAIGRQSSANIDIVPTPQYASITISFFVILAFSNALL